MIYKVLLGEGAFDCLVGPEGEAFKHHFWPRGREFDQLKIQYVWYPEGCPAAGGGGGGMLKFQTDWYIYMYDYEIIIIIMRI